jgi:hypothetical protein
MDEELILPTKIAATLSGRFLHSAAEVYFRCIRQRGTKDVRVTDDNNYSDGALDAVILSATALEAFINEVSLGPISMRLYKKMEFLGEWLERLDIRQKYCLIPYLLWERTWDRGSQPYQDFETLVALRNELVHYKMKPYELGGMPPCAKELWKRGMLLTPAGQAISSFWGDEICCSKVALWAHNTACRMSNGLIEMGDDNSKILWGGKKRFAEIPEDYWKTMP